MDILRKLTEQWLIFDYQSKRHTLVYLYKRIEIRTGYFQSITTFSSLSTTSVTYFPVMYVIAANCFSVTVRS